MPDTPPQAALGGGRCLCGAVRFETEAPPLWQSHCHCESCRRATSSPFTSYFGMAEGAWRWTGAPPAEYASSPGVMRYFCGRCGSPMAYRSDRWPEEMHFFAASLDDPARYRPENHVFWAEHLPWIALADGLPVRP